MLASQARRYRAERCVGVVIPTRNGELYLAEALESVLRQTHRPLEVVVADDGSTDATLELAQRYAPAVRVLALPHRGLGATRNAGVEALSGDFVAFLDQDDVWSQRKLELQLAAFDAPSPPELVFGHVREFISPELEPQLAGHIRCVSEPRPAALPGTMLATRAALVRVGPFSTRWVSNDFMAWLLAAGRLGLRERVLTEHVLSRRLHLSNYSRLTASVRSEYLHVIKESLDLRRRSATA